MIDVRIWLMHRKFLFLFFVFCFVFAIIFKSHQHNEWNGFITDWFVFVPSVFCCCFCNHDVIKCTYLHVRQQQAETMMFWPSKGDSKYITIKVFCVACVALKVTIVVVVVIHFNITWLRERNEQKGKSFFRIPKNRLQSSILSTKIDRKSRKRAIKQKKNVQSADQVTDNLFMDVKCF